MIDTTTAVGPADCAQPGVGGPYDPHIRCPLCGWRPRVDSLWICRCTDPSGHMANPFRTGGVCPGCLGQCAYLQCAKCRKYSPHADWYEFKG